MKPVRFAVVSLVILLGSLLTAPVEAAPLPIEQYLTITLADCTTDGGHEEGITTIAYRQPSVLRLTLRVDGESSRSSFLMSALAKGPATGGWVGGPAARRLVIRTSMNGSGCIT
jgi:hypothetical protein